MPERIYQHQFGEDFSPLKPEDVTPENFTGLNFPDRDRKFQPRLTTMGRFVREVREQVHITSPSDAARYLVENVYTPFEQFDQEELWILLLNNKNRITHEVMVYRGTVNTVYIRAAELFKEAIRVNATALILSHCRPSGDPTPSPEDVRVTHQANELARLLDLDLLDHLVVGKNSWVSLKERSLGFDTQTG